MRVKFARTFRRTLQGLGIGVLALSLVGTTCGGPDDAPDPFADSAPGQSAPPTQIRGTMGAHPESPRELVKRLRGEIPKAADLPRAYDSGVFRGNPYLEKLPFDQNSVIADIGAGTGALEVAILLSGRPFERLYAVDIDHRAVEFVELLIGQYFPKQAKKITTVASTPYDVKLPPGTVDLAVMVNTHFFVPRNLRDDNDREKAVTCLKSLGRSLKSNGRLHVFQSQYVSLESKAELSVSFEEYRRQELAEIQKVFAEAGLVPDLAAVDEQCNCYRLILRRQGA